jgi:hypothetical protein
VSAAVILPMRDASGSETGLVEYASGFWRVRMRAMLHAFAPKSRM